MSGLAWRNITSSRTDGWASAASCCTSTNSSPGSSHLKFEQFQKIQSRRKFFRECAGGLGTIALGSMLARDGYGAVTANPLAPKLPPLPATAKNVIFLFMEGGPSQLDLFDPKPEL